MSKKVSFKAFCIQHELDPDSEQAEIEYLDYCDKIDFVNQLFAEHEANEAISKMKK